MNPEVKVVSLSESEKAPPDILVGLELPLLVLPPSSEMPNGDYKSVTYLVSLKLLLITTCSVISRGSFSSSSSSSS